MPVGSRLGGETLHREEFSLDGVVGLIQQDAGHRHLGIFQHRIPAGFLVLKPLAHTMAVASPAVRVTWSAQWRNRWPSANTRTLFRWRTRYNKV